MMHENILPTDAARECLEKVLSWIKEDGGKSKLEGCEDSFILELGCVEEARALAGNDMVALMTRVFPIISFLTAQAVQDIGYTSMGVLEFEQAVQQLIPQ